MTKAFFFSLATFVLLFSACSSESGTSPQQQSTTTPTTAPKADTTKAQMTIGSKPIVLDTTPPAGDSSIYEGDVLMKYPNGVIMVKGTKSRGKRIGQWVTFHENGQVWSEGTYKNGLRQGRGVSYYDNGKKSSEGMYKDSKLIGIWKYWDEAGHVVKYDMGDGTTTPKAVQ